MSSWGNSWGGAWGNSWGAMIRVLEEIIYYTGRTIKSLTYKGTHK